MRWSGREPVPVPEAGEPAAAPPPVHEPAPAGAARARRSGRLLRPRAYCPRCGTAPALRVTAAMVHAVSGVPEGTCLGTYRCQRRGCGAIYALNAGAYLHAL